MRILTIGFAVFCVCITAAYTANLMAQLSTTILTTQISTLSDLAVTRTKYARDVDGTGKAYFAATKDPVVLEIAPRVVVATAGASSECPTPSPQLPLSKTRVYHIEPDKFKITKDRTMRVS